MALEWVRAAPEWVLVDKGQDRAEPLARGLVAGRVAHLADSRAQAQEWDRAGSSKTQ